MMKKEKTLKRRMLYLFAVIPVIAVMGLAFGNYAIAAEMPLQEMPAPEDMPKAGEIISGTVSDNDGPIMMVNVTEQDENGRIMAHAVTDINGDYTFRLAGEGHWLVVSYIGYGEHKEIIYSNNMNVRLAKLERSARITIKNDGTINVLLMNTLSGQTIPINSLNELSDLLNSNKTEKCILSVARQAPSDVLTGIKNVLREQRILNIVYESQSDDFDPIITVDGEIREVSPEKRAKFDFNPQSIEWGPLSELISISPSEFATLTILKGKAATDVWGDKGKKGVIALTTKKAEDHGNAEDMSSVQSDDEVPFMVTESMPEFPGGSMALMEYLRTNLRYPAEARDKNIQGRTVISFIVEKDGSITNPEVRKSIHPLLDNEAIRVVSTMPKWIPGTQHGDSVRVSYSIPINFRLSSESTFSTLLIYYYKDMETALISSRKQPANSALKISVDYLDQALDELIRGQREYIEMDYEFNSYTRIQDALNSHGIDKIKYDADAR